MLSTTKPLLERTAEELMSRDVLTIPRGMSLRAAAHRLTQAGVSGAPVTDEAGRCVGVLSRADLVRCLDRFAVDRSADEVPTDWQVCAVDELPADNVTRCMSTDVIAAGPHTRAGELARLMYAHHIHRVLITDPWGQVIGIVGSMDLLGALAAEDAGR